MNPLKDSSIESTKKLGPRSRLYQTRRLSISIVLLSATCNLSAMAQISVSIYLTLFGSTGFFDFKGWCSGMFIRWTSFRNSKCVQRFYSGESTLLNLLETSPESSKHIQIRKVRSWSSLAIHSLPLSLHWEHQFSHGSTRWPVDFYSRLWIEIYDSKLSTEETLAIQNLWTETYEQKVSARNLWVFVFWKQFSSSRSSRWQRRKS